MTPLPKEPMGENLNCGFPDPNQCLDTLVRVSLENSTPYRCESSTAGFGIGKAPMEDVHGLCDGRDYFAKTLFLCSSSFTGVPTTKGPPLLPFQSWDRGAHSFPSFLSQLLPRYYHFYWLVFEEGSRGGGREHNAVPQDTTSAAACGPAPGNLASLRSLERRVPPPPGVAVGRGENARSAAYRSWARHGPAALGLPGAAPYGVEAAVWMRVGFGRKGDTLPKHETFPQRAMRHTDCPKKLWVPHLWMYSRPGQMMLWTGCSDV